MVFGILDNDIHGSQCPNSFLGMGPDKCFACAIPGAPDVLLDILTADQVQT